MWNLIIKNFVMTVKIIVMVTILLIITEYLELKYKGKIREKLIGRPINQYVIARADREIIAIRARVFP